MCVRVYRNRNRPSRDVLRCESRLTPRAARSAPSVRTGLHAVTVLGYLSLATRGREISANL
eukprot:929433-Prymnesium_polylepis.1